MHIKYLLVPIKRTKNILDRERKFSQSYSRKKGKEEEKGRKEGKGREGRKEERQQGRKKEAKPRTNTKQKIR